MPLKDQHIYSREQEIADVRIGRPHVVILGAGASLAAFPDGDRNGRRGWPRINPEETPHRVFAG